MTASQENQVLTYCLLLNSSSVVTTKYEASSLFINEKRALYLPAKTSNSAASAAFPTRIASPAASARRDDISLVEKYSSRAAWDREPSGSIFPARISN